MPINIHRLLANVVFGGAIVGAYAAYRFLAWPRADEERAHYDWMGYVGNFIAIGALIVLPFAGYYLGREIYEFNQQMGITMMGGFMSWLWIIQAFLIGILFLAGNYYLWVGMGRIPGRRALYALYQVPPRHAHGGRRDRLGDAPHHDREPRRARGHGRHPPPLP